MGEQLILCQTIDLVLTITIAYIHPKDNTPQPTPGPSHTIWSSHLHLPPTTNPTNLMDASEDRVPGPANLPMLPDILSHVWVTRENRLECQDEDLFSRLLLPLPEFESSGGQDLNGNEAGLEDLDSESEEESQTSVHITASQQLNTEFELQAARAGMCSQLL